MKTEKKHTLNTTSNLNIRETTVAVEWGRLQAVIQQAGVSQIDLFVCTHYHADHYGDVDELIRELGITLGLSKGRPILVGRFSSNYSYIREVEWICQLSSNFFIYL